MLVSRLLGHRHKESNQEQDDTHYDQSQRPLASSPQSSQNCLLSLFGRDLIILLVVEVGEGHNQQTEHSVQAVEGVVDNLQHEKRLVHAIWRRPILLRAQFAGCRCTDESNVHGQQQDRGQQGEEGEPADERHGKVALAGLLVDEDEKGGDEEQNAQAHGVRDPDE